MLDNRYSGTIVIDLPAKKKEKDIKESQNLIKSEEIINEFLRTGENRFFEMLVSRYKDRVFHLVLSVLGAGHSFEAEDVTQEVFVKVFRQLSQFSFKSKFGTWLYRITYNTAVDYKRKARSRLTHLGENAIVNTPTARSRDDPYKVAANKKRCEEVQACMEKLPDIYRSILYLYYWLGHSTKEIAEYLNISQETVKSYLHRARQKLHRRMKQRGVSYEP